MTEAKSVSYTEFALPPSVVSRIDIARLVSDAERVDNELTTLAVRATTGASTTADEVAFSTPLKDFLSLNQLSVEDGRVRSEIIKQLRKLKDHVPVIHMTFSTAADPESLGKLMQWLRDSIHPQVVLAVGLQPGLVAGVYVRTPNHVHDLSLRAKLKEQRSLIAKELEAVSGGR